MTELLCTNPGANCGKVSLFSCKQMKSMMEVVYRKNDRLSSSSSPSTDSPDVLFKTEDISVRNETFNTGCSCTVILPNTFNSLHSGTPEK